MAAAGAEDHAPAGAPDAADATPSPPEGLLLAAAHADARVELARQATAQTREATRALQEQNARIRAHLRDVAKKQRMSQSNVSDADAERARREFATAAAERRADRARVLRQSNVDMQRRLKNLRARTDTSRAGAAVKPSGGDADETGGATGGSSGGGKRLLRSSVSAAGSSSAGAGDGRSASALEARSPFHSASASAVQAELSLARYGQYDDANPDDEAAEVKQLRELFKSPRFDAAAGDRFAGDHASRFSDIGDPNYRRLENTTHAPVGESNAAQRYFAASETKRNPRGGWSKNPEVPKWDPRPLRPVPYEVRGMRPGATKEPWTPALKDAWSAPGQFVRDQRRKSLGVTSGAVPRSTTGRTTAGGAYATATFSRLDDGMYDSIAQAFNRRSAEDRQKAVATNRKPWDPTAWRTMPPSIKGLRCVTDEPWARDDELFEVDLTPREGQGLVDERLLLH